MGKEDVVEYEQLARVVNDGLPHILPDPDRRIEIVMRFAIGRRGERCLLTMDMPTTDAERLRMSFDDPLLPSPSVINRQLKRVLTRAGLPAMAFSPHALRHTAVTNLLRCGLPIEMVADVVGHGSIDTTRTYVKSSGRLQEWRRNTFNG